MKIKYLLMVGSVVLLFGCMSVPKKNLSSEAGIIAAHLEVEIEQVEELQSQEYSRENIIKMLIISESSYLTIEEVKQKRAAGEEITDIAQKAGIEEAILNRETEKIKESISGY